MRSSLNPSLHGENYTLRGKAQELFLMIPAPELELISETILAVENVLQG